MPESPIDKPLMTIIPDGNVPGGYVPRRMQLEKVKGSRPSFVQPEVEEKPESSTQASNGFLRKSFATSGIFMGLGASIFYGANMGMAIANENSGLTLISAVGVGLGAVGAGVNTFLFLKK